MMDRQLALGMGLRPEPDETESLVRERWVRLKRGRLPTEAEIKV